MTISKALLDVITERNRQIHEEGFDAKHDDDYLPGIISQAGACYTVNAANQSLDTWQHKPELRTRVTWPWGEARWKPTTPRRDLVKAAALILAEIERMDRNGN